ncbi:FAD-dependent monooxygenase [Microlunatus antarcticus]|uniref:2-polyprenyl-6-methoxyphenol hydroxylase-like FAD-dependent oxidoreductase n=1 Tax=Microlunatus antarcticus TaxID=53388 RepID=A0A7W5JV71_9ACTN|nr:FAD-dependent monooxygenase [Microlunatus antarcticus]MBB3326979.1 2-polyprenyl-6-methoxyphenol hydroxylase-like FAD-dependent oxidoreductase [Microlunatus antarcticus]
MTASATTSPPVVPSELDHQVGVVGAGPTGLLVAAELALAGVDVVVLDRYETPDTTIKAGSINVATAEILDRRGLRPAAEAAQRRFGEELKAFAAANGTPLPPMGGRPPAGGRPPFPSTGHFAGLFFRPDLVDQADPDITAHAGSGGSTLVRQSEVEALLLAHLAGLGVEVVRGVEVTAMDPLLNEEGVEVGRRLSTSRGPLRVGWVIGADGGRSSIRRTAGIDFVGTDAEITGYQAIADLDGTDGLGRGWHHTPTGVYSLGPVPGRILTVQFTGAPDRAVRDRPVTAAELQASIRLVTGQEVTVRAIHGAATRWTDNARQATTYRAGRVLLAGDAAHVHSPFSGQGLNLGAGDAVNLGWKLAATIHGWAPEGLLDTYTTERHPIGAQVLDWTRAQVALMRGDDKTIQLRRIVAQELLANTATTTHLVLVTSGVAQRYDLNPTADHEDDTSRHALVGRQVGDTPLADGGRLADHFHTGRFVLLDRLGGDLAAISDAWNDRVETVTERAASTACPDAYRTATGLLVRPDGVIAWATDSTDAAEAAAGLTAALDRWAGESTQAAPATAG